MRHPVVTPPEAVGYPLVWGFARALLIGTAWMLGLLAINGPRTGTSHARLNAATRPDRASGNPAGTRVAMTIALTIAQLAAFKIVPVGCGTFPIRDQAVGSIHFDEGLPAQVFTPYQGRIVTLYAKVPVMT